MIRKTKRNPSIFNIKSDLKKLGVTLIVDDDSYELYLDEDPDMYAVLGKDVSNLEEVLETGIKISKIKPRTKYRTVNEAWKNRSKNPRCRTLQVKRKVGKKIIKVKRKICRNPKGDFDSYLEGSPYFQFLYNKYGDEIPVEHARLYAGQHNIQLSDLNLPIIRGKYIDTLEFVKELGY